MRILLIEDEVPLAEALSQILKNNNYSVDISNDGECGLDNALSNIYDIIILDIMLPKIDGLSILKTIRKEGISTPLMLLTARGKISDKVEGLDSGADDYLAKPFSTEELLARIRAMSRRRSDVIQDNLLRFGDLNLDMSTLKLSTENKSIKLILKEANLLELLITRKSFVSSKELIIEKLWGFDSNVEYNHVEVYISFLRKKLAFLNSKVTIDTIRGIGYILELN